MARTAGLAVLAAGCLAACSSSDHARREPPNPDPFEPVNRVMYRFNDVADRYVGKPVAKAYEKGTPVALRAGAGNFLDNLRYPITIINDFLQGKGKQGAADLARFTMNSTVGLFGLFDPASKVGLKAHDEDFGQTFSVWGLPEGPYLMVPIFGPYTVSSAAGDLVGTQASLLIQLPEGRTRTALVIWYLIQERYSLLGFDEQIRQAYDPYIFIRDSYLQNRLYKRYDGNVPDSVLYPEESLEDEDEAP